VDLDLLRALDISRVVWQPGCAAYRARISLDIDGGCSVNPVADGSGALWWLISLEPLWPGGRLDAGTAKNTYKKSTVASSLLMHNGRSIPALAKWTVLVTSAAPMPRQECHAMEGKAESVAARNVQWLRARL
jgi:hypothetical protein